ncbi:MAG: phenylalanine--tRNA ligase subunit beta [Gemmatimonadales bacterium]
MNVSVGWLSAMLGRELDPADAAERLSMQCAAAEAVTPVYPDVQDVIVGLVESVEKHPNADRLTLCRVNDGNGVVEVVCGAPNVEARRRYPYAPVGAVLPGGLKLTARKIRGIKSHGMLCSEAELQLGADRDGIMELAGDLAPGTPLVEAISPLDWRLEVEVTPNRPDLLGHKGIARELGASYGAPVKLPEIPDAPDEGASPRTVASKGTVDGVEVTIEDTEGCPRYMAAVIRGVTVGPSPEWLQKRLIAVGARPINNVVDATNYILYELNQPLHAFDLPRLLGSAIIVRRPRKGERLTTLDGEERALEPDMTMICDAESPTAVAGVMGGADSEVTQATKDVLLECAYFDPRRIRATRRALKLTTEASYRFERGTDMESMPAVLRRAVRLIRAVAGGEEREAAIDVYPRPAKPRVIFVRPERVSRLLGVEIQLDEIERLLVSVGFAVAPKNGRMHVQIPGWRPDVTREVDLIEEVARLRGYDSFPVESRPIRPSVVPDDPVEPLKASIRELFTALGLHEARSLPLVPERGEESQEILNPLSAEEAHLRRRILPGLVRAVERNWAARERDVRLFEVGKVFRRRPAGGPPDEWVSVAGVVTGSRTPHHWSAAGRPPDYDLWDVRTMLEEVTRTAGPVAKLVEQPDGWVLVDETGGECGWAGEIRVERPAWAGLVFGFEANVVVRERPAVAYRPLPATPPLERDMALVLPEGVTAGRVEAVMREAGGPLLEGVHVFDEYRGAGVEGRSVAWRLVLRAPDRTLRDEEADVVEERILRALKERLDVARRA